MSRRLPRFLSRALALTAIVFATGLYKPRNRSGSSGGSDGDSGGGRPRTNHAGSDAPVGRQQSSLTATATGSTARPKTPAAPTPPRQRLPRGRKRQVTDPETGKTTTITMPDSETRDRPETNYTSGYTENLPPPKYDSETDSWTINLRKHDDWDQGDFDSKSNHLRQLGEDGALNKKTGDGEDRSGAVDTWRSAKEREIFFNAQSQEDLDQRIYELDGQQIDHAHELQLGGRDEHANMWAIDAATNHGMGGQINSQLSRVPDGARVKVNIM
ncbi:hypothetical protein [Glycomyces xiaoerkulensis]|uniref:hypothetical protein n=1 Tax=Glycomyces xiaoerkulensis TaxID=2038139 RepID=UPI0012FFD9D7|nr:hypothetical protein [Glycomyces xiaoerkulensis]